MIRWGKERFASEVRLTVKSVWDTHKPHGNMKSKTGKNSEFEQA